MKKGLAICLVILTLCQCSLGSVFNTASSATISSSAEKNLFQIHQECTEHNHDHEEEHDQEHGTTPSGDYSKKADELYVYAAAVCTSHTYGSYTVTRAATCTSTGSKTRSCTKCGATNTASIAALGHMFGGQPYSVAATCTAAGYDYNTCSRCGAQNKFNTKPSLGHNYSQVTKTPTCVSTGTAKCSRCGGTSTIPATGVHSYTVTVTAATCTSSGTKKCANCTATTTTSALGHKFEGSVYNVPATCTADGYSYNLCSRCNAKNKFGFSDPAGHNYTLVTKEATCIATGTKKCSRCTSTTSIPATGVHNYSVTTVAATCTSTGTKKCATCTATQTIQILGHKFEGSVYDVPATCTAQGYSYNECSRCGAKNKFGFSDAAGHNYSQTTKEPTCVSTGTKKCSRCTSTTSIPATGVHSYTVTSVAATCTSSGTNKCANCSATQTTSALGHMFGGEPFSIPATCYVGGYSYVKCSRCTAENRFNETAAAGHSYSQVVTPATCTTAGTLKCSRCTSTTSSSALNHMFGGEPYHVTAKCEEGGYSYVLCTRCNVEKSKFNLTSPLGHKFSEVVKSPTCIAAGTNKCSRCTETSSTPATGVHSYTVTVVAPDCNNTGVNKCETCTDDQIVAKLGHKFEGQPSTIPASCEEEGYTYVLCSRCTTERYKFDIKPKLGHNYSEIIKNPTCINEGTNKCSRCTRSISTAATGVHKYTIRISDPDCENAGTNKCETCPDIQPVNKLGHKFDGQPQSVAAACEVEGYTYILCSNCHTEEYRFDITPILGHRYNIVIVEPGCETVGTNKCVGCVKTDTTPATDHTYDTTYKHNETSHWKECTVCNKPTASVLHSTGSGSMCSVCKYDTVIEVERIMLTQLPLELYTGKDYTIVAVVLPENVIDKTLTWSSSNTSVATVSSNGVVTPLDSGSVTITATSKDGVSAGITVSVRKVVEIPMLIGDGLQLGATLQDWSVDLIQGLDIVLRINQDNSVIALNAGEAIILVEDLGIQYYRIIVSRQEKLTRDQVINLAGPAPSRLREHTSNERTFTFDDIICDIDVESTLYTYYLYDVLPKLSGMPLQAEHSLSVRYEEQNSGFGEWLWMMYGHMAPTKEELVVKYISFAEQLPICDLVIGAYKAYIQFENGETGKALLLSGVVAVKAVGYFYSIKDIIKSSQFTFGAGARGTLASMSDDVISPTMRNSLLTMLDDYERTLGLAPDVIDNYVALAVKNSSSNTVMLGTTGTYDILAGSKGYTYFKFTETEWDNLVAAASNNYDEVWKVNMKFIDDQIVANKEILLTNDPNVKYLFEDGSLRFYQREIDYLISSGYSFNITTDGLWKAIK